jgi:hypothetical protein
MPPIRPFQLAVTQRKDNRTTLVHNAVRPVLPGQSHRSAQQPPKTSLPSLTHLECVVKSPLKAVVRLVTPRLVVCKFLQCRDRQRLAAVSAAKRLDSLGTPEAAASTAV